MKRLLPAVFALSLLLFSFSLALASPANIPQTGQTTCYNTSGTPINCVNTGQDGDTQMGIDWPSPRFIDNSNSVPADQTVTDNLTGLVWAKDANLIATRDPLFDAVGTLGDGMVTWQHALDYVKKLNTENYLGHNDWRLPNMIELLSLTNKGQDKTEAWLNTQGFSNVQDSSYWSSNTPTDFANGAWIVYMGFGTLESALKNTGLYVWPVRGGQSGLSGTVALPKTGQTTCYDESGTIIDCSGTGQDGELQTGTAWPEPRFADNGDQTLYDSLTGLTWSKDANPAAGTTTWQGALDFIKTLNSSNYLGHSDWRLPNSNELESLMNKGHANFAAWLNTQGFLNVQNSAYVTSTTSQNAYWYGTVNQYNTYERAWYVNINGGVVHNYNKDFNYNVWPVRGGFSGTVVHQNIVAHLNIAKVGTGSGAVAPDSGSIVWNGNRGTGDYPLHDTVVLTATPDSGSSFAGWAGCTTVAGTVCSVTMDTAKNVFATFVPSETLLPASWNYGEIALNSTTSSIFFTLSNNSLSSLTVTSTTITGANPTQFSVTPGTCSSLTPTIAPATSCTLNVTFSPTTLGPKSATLHVTSNSVNNPILEAQLSGIGIIPYYTLTTTIQGFGRGQVYFFPGGSCSGSCSQTFAANRTVLLTPLADTGSQFTGWSGCDSVNGETCTVTMTWAKSVTATFMPAPSLVEWWVSNGPAGGIISALALNPSSPATVFAGTTNGAGLYRSDNSGSSWNQSTTGLTDTAVSSLAVNPLNPAIIYADTLNSGLFKSDDGGATWSLLNSDLKGARALVVNPVTPNILYASGCGGICKSIDGGATWNPVNEGITIPDMTTNISSLAINPANPDILYAGAQGAEIGMYSGMFKSTDGGILWQSLSINLPYYDLSSIAIDPITPDTLYVGTISSGVYKSTDAGASWSQVGNGLNGLSSANVLAVNPAIPSIIYAGTFWGMYRSTDGGITWSPVIDGLTTAEITTLAIDPTTPSIVYAGTNGGGVFKLSMVTAAPVIAVSPASSDFGVVATQSSSSTVPFTISNNGNGALYITSTTLGGADPGSFTLQPGTCLSLTDVLLPGWSCTMEVTFVPTSVGAKNAYLQVVSSDPEHPLTTVALSGIAYDPPPVGLVTINNGAWFTNTSIVTLALAAFDNSGTVAAMRFSNNNSSWSDWELYGATKNWNLTDLGGDGVKTVYVQFRDSSWNVSGSFADSIILDTTPPVTTITSMPAPYYPASEGSFTFSASESATFQCRMDTGDWAGCSSPYSFSGLADGSHTFSVKATDLAGNLEAAGKSYTFSIDTTAPDTTITGQPAALSNSASGTFAFTSPDGAVTYQCKVDSGAWGHCNFAYSFSNLADGSHTFSVRGIDQSGNMDLTPATYTWIIDTTPPESILTASVSGNSATFTVSSNDPTAILQCALDTAAWAVCSGTVSFTGLSSGSHSFSVRAIDPVGNVDPTPAIYSWTYSCNVRVAGGSCYASIGEAVAAAPDGGAIQAKAMSFVEEVNCSYSKSLTFSGGFGPNFEPPAPGAMTMVNGLTITTGMMTVDNLVVQ